MNIMFFLKPKSEVAHIYDDDTVRQVLERMEYHRYSCIPMLNRQGKYVGSITEGDLLWWLKGNHNLNLKLAEMEQAGKLSAIVTQNIDGLHQAAGSKNVFELHGSVHRNYCQKCGKFFDVNYVVNAKGVPYCDECGGIIKPDVVLYEEGLDSQTINGAVRAISKADMLIIGGTSLVVYPAAGMIDYFKGKYLAVLNRDATSRDKQADLCITDPIGEVLGRIRV